ncbi:MAG: GGDEF domain-containing protein [Thermodesulfobacteriota bacterium]
MIKHIFSCVLIAGAATLVYLSDDFDFVKNFLKLSPHLVWVFAGLTLAVCLRFNKSRLSFLLALLLLLFFKGNIPFVSAIPQQEFMTFFCLNVLFLAGFRERGVFTVHGLNKAVFILVQVGLLFYVTVYDHSLYLKPDHRAVRAIYAAVNLPFPVLPFILLFAAAVRHVFRDRSHDISVALGIMIGFTALAARGIKPTELHMVSAFFLMFIGALSSIYIISYMDELTGLPGRRSYNEFTATLGAKYAIAMADIDHFKKFNDKFGHDTGDEVLKLVAGILSSVGGGGKTFRLGGEEFVIVFSGKSRETAAEHLETLRRKIAQTPFIVRNKKSRENYRKTGVKTKPAEPKTIKITLSFGASDSWGGKKLIRVMKEADIALYKSKKKGRNRVTIS